MDKLDLNTLTMFITHKHYIFNTYFMIDYTQSYKSKGIP